MIKQDVLPPHSEQAEKAVLGGILCDDSAMPKVHKILESQDFYGTHHAIIYQAMLGIYEACSIPDLITVHDRLTSSGQLDKVGGAIYLSTLADSSPSAANIEYHAKIVKEMSTRRQFIDEARKIIEQAQDRTISQREIPTRLAIDISHDAEIKHVSAVTQELNKNIENGYPGLPSCYDILSKTIRRVFPGHLIIIGAYTSIGKSAFLVDLICRMYRIGINPGIAIFSTEMSCEQYLVRCLSNQTEISGWAITENKLYDEQVGEVEKAKSHFNSRNLYLYDNLYKIEDIERTARMLKNEVKLDVLAIDYIQNLWGDGTIYERMSRLSPILQYLAKELQITIIALSQVSNQHVRENMGSIFGYKGAGEIAASADLGIELVRTTADNRRILCQVKKNRHGPTGEGLLEFDAKFTRLTEILDDGNKQYGG